jgi:hypothetical protein
MQAVSVEPAALAQRNITVLPDKASGIALVT